MKTIQAWALRYPFRIIVPGLILGTIALYALLQPFGVQVADLVGHDRMVSELRGFLSVE